MTDVTGLPATRQSKVSVRLLPACLLAMTFLPGGTAARQTSFCDVSFVRAPRAFYVEAVAGYVRQFLGGGVIARCLGTSTRIAADSVAYYEDQLRAVFIGNVRFDDSTAVLEADRAFYFLADDRLEAYGNARLQNLNTGTVLTGPNLTYFRVAPGLREEAELYASQRPTISYYSDTTQAEPYIIVANQVRMVGDDRAWSGGDVTIDRSDFRARGDSSVLNMTEERGILIGHANVEGGDSTQFQVSGRDIAFTFLDGDLNWVQSRGLADARNSEFGLVADTIEFSIEENMIHSSIAWGDSIRPRAVSRVNTIEADSLAIDSPQQVLHEIRSYGTARATSVRDSLDTEADWVAGDTVIARFDEGMEGIRILNALDAIGNAVAYYRIFDPEADLPPDLNYSRGLKISARFDDDGVDRVDVIGKADGVHLEPVRRRP
jgi:lipopolysaccharide export system protein LptA